MTIEGVDVEDCIFCKVASGEIPTKFVYEDESVVAFDDISPQAPVHALIIPRRHFEHLADGVDSQTLLSLTEAIPEVAQRKGIAESGYRVIINKGPNANQTVSHLHIHVMGGKPMSHGMVRFEDE